MAASVYYGVLSAMQTAITALNLTFDSVAAPVVIRKLPRVEETIDGTLPLLCIAPHDRPERIEPWQTENQFLIVYACEVVLVAAGNRDFTDTNLDTWLSWRQQVRTAFLGNVLDGINSVFRMQVNPEVPLDRSKLSKSYEYSGMGFAWWSIESGSVPL